MPSRDTFGAAQQINDPSLGQRIGNGPQPTVKSIQRPIPASKKQYTTPCNSKAGFPACLIQSGRELAFDLARATSHAHRYTHTRTREHVGAHAHAYTLKYTRSITTMMSGRLDKNFRMSGRLDTISCRGFAPALQV